MGPKSVYRSLRPIMVVCCLFGQFSIVNFTTKTSARLKVKYLSITSLFFIAEQVIVACTTIIVIIDEYKDDGFLSYHHFPIFVYIAVGVWFLLRSNKIIKSITAVDELRSTLDMVPCQYRPNTPVATAAGWLMCTLLLTPLLSYAIVWNFSSISDPFKLFQIFLYNVFECSAPDRINLLLCLLFYNSGLVIRDTVHACQIGIKKTTLHLKLFCELLMIQAHILKDIENCIQYEVLLLIVIKLARLTIELPLFTPLHDFIVYWEFLCVCCLHSCVLIARISFASLQVLTGEVFALPNVGISKRDAVKMKVLQSQLQAPVGEFTASGYVKVDWQLFSDMLALGINYLIVYVQYSSLYDPYRALIDQ